MNHNNFSSLLCGWYKENARDLPWRKTSNPYYIWVSEVMLQQTTVSAVIPYYNNWLKVFPVIQSVAKAPLQKILKIWQGLGYYQRVKNLHKSAQIICEGFQGAIPNDPNILRKFPGFGPYTVGAVLSIAYDSRLPIIDANVRRVVMRLQGTLGYADTKQDSKILKFLEHVLPKKNIGAFNQAFMELGALICQGREPNCIQCPVQLHCKSFEAGIQNQIPTPKKAAIKDIEKAVALIEKDGRYLIQQRSSEGLLADLWEFPGRPVQKGTSVENTLSFGLAKDLGVNVFPHKKIMQVRHFYTQFRVTLLVWSCSIDSFVKKDSEFKWVSPQGISKYPMPSGSIKIAKRLMEEGSFYK